MQTCSGDRGLSENMVNGKDRLTILLSYRRFRGVSPGKLNPGRTAAGVNAACDAVGGEAHDLACQEGLRLQEAHASGTGVAEDLGAQQ